jgi:hypothetical protein
VLRAPAPGGKAGQALDVTGLICRRSGDGVTLSLKRAERKFTHSTEVSGGVCHRSSKAPRGEDLEIEQPVSCGDCSSFHFHATLAGMLGPTLIQPQVIQGREPRQKRLLAPSWMMAPCHREQFPLAGVVGLI